MQDSLRQPLSSGSASLARWARLGAALPGLASVGLAIECFRAEAPIGAAIGVAVGVVLLVPAAIAPLTPGETASDLLFEAAGLRVVGGPHDGLSLRWDEIDPQGVELVEAREKRVTVAVMLAHLFFLVFSTLLADKPELAPDEGDLTARLWVRTRAGRRLLLARGVEADEVESLRALHEALRGRLSPAPVVDDAPPTAVRCPACAAPARPSEEPAVACAFCRSPVPMPDPVRRRIAEHRALAATGRAVDSLVARLARLPSARSATTASRAVFAAVTLLAVGAGVVFLLLALADAVDVFAFGMLAVACGLLVLAAWRFAARFVVDRQAMGAIGALFGARAPRREGEAWGCRSCGAPLPAAPGAVLRCAYCDVESVPGMDAGQLISPMKRGQHALEEQALRHAQRRASADRSAVVLGLLAAGSLFVLVVLGGMGLELLEERRACEAGRGDACYGVALAYFNGTARADRARALVVAEKSCRLGSAEGCCFVRDFARFRWGAPKDLPAAERAIEAATRKAGRSPCSD